MGAGARTLFHGSVGQPVRAIARLPRSGRGVAKGRTAAGTVWKGNVHLHRLCVLSPASGGRTGRGAVVRESAGSRARQYEGGGRTACGRNAGQPLSRQARMSARSDQGEARPQLIRGVGLGGATALNMIDMIGVGPFITMPLILGAMGGPQAMLGWILGAVFAICDGLVWAELGAAMPGSGGSYRYLREIYGRDSAGRLISFLFIWQLSFSAPMSIATGALGLAGYASYFWPGLEATRLDHNWSVMLPFVGPLQVRWLVNGGTFLAIGVLAVAVVLLYRKVTSIGWLSKMLLAGVLGTMLWIIVAGVSHFDAARAFSFPPNAFHLSQGFFLGMGSALLIAAYDYWGYYNVCFLGDEIQDPGRNIPRALLLSILLVACLYLMMNICILAVVPWRELLKAGQNNTGLYVVSLFMQRIYGPWAGRLVTGLVIVTA